MARPCPRAWESVYVRCPVECGAFTGDGLTKYIQSDANEKESQSLVENNRFEIKNETEDQAQSIPKSIGTLTVLRCMFGPNPDYDPWWLMARTNSQDETGVKFDFEVKFDLDGQGQSTPKQQGS